MLPQDTDPMEYFDRDKPTVTQIRQRYADNFVDLRDYFHDHGALPNIVVAEAIINAAKYNKGLILPKEYSFWDRGKTFKRAFLRNELGIPDVPISTPLRFKKLGDELNITTTKLTKGKIKKMGLTPRGAFKAVFGNPDIKRKWMETPLRGWGYWDISGRKHKIVPFDVVFEGHLFRTYYSDRLVTHYQFADSLMDIPSRSESGAYMTEFLVLPVTAAAYEYLIEWMKLDFKHVCKDDAFKSFSSRHRMERDELGEKVHKYANPESHFDTHVYGGLEKIEDQSEKDSRLKPLLVKFPRARKLSPFDVVSRRMIKETDTGFERPIKADLTVAMGLVSLHPDLDIEQLYDLEE